MENEIVDLNEARAVLAVKRAGLWSMLAPIGFALYALPLLIFATSFGGGDRFNELVTSTSFVLNPVTIGVFFLVIGGYLVRTLELSSRGILVVLVLNVIACIVIIKSVLPIVALFFITNGLLKLKKASQYIDGARH